MSLIDKTRAVLFDLDGTLVNSLEDLADSMNQVLISRGYALHPVDSYRYHVGDGLRNLVLRTIPEENSKDDKLVEAYMEEMLHVYNGRWKLKSKLYDGIPELLDNLTEKGITLAIFSNKPDSFTKSFYDHFLKKWGFTSVLGATKNLPLKPDPTGATKSAENLSIPAEEFLYLGDTATDMQTARNAGMYAVGALWGFREKNELIESGANTVINHPLDLIPLLNS